jgi:hypothetical protein
MVKRHNIIATLNKIFTIFLLYLHVILKIEERDRGTAIEILKDNPMMIMVEALNCHL